MSPVQVWAVLGIVGTIAGSILFIMAFRRLIKIYQLKQNGIYRLTAWLLLFWPLSLAPIYIGITLLTIQNLDDAIEWTVTRVVLIAFEAYIVFWTVILAIGTFLVRRHAIEE